MVDMQWVDSSNLEQVGYDEAKMELYVGFKGGETYVYQDVPQSIFDQLMTAPSKGSFLNREVKNTYSFYKQ
jgi:hypothetical protein